MLVRIIIVFIGVAIIGVQVAVDSIKLNSVVRFVKIKRTGETGVCRVKDDNAISNVKKFQRHSSTIMISSEACCITDL